MSDFKNQHIYYDLNKLLSFNKLLNISIGARGLGKSDIAVVIAQYHMYRVMCLKDPLAYFNLRPTEKICFAFSNGIIFMGFNCCSLTHCNVSFSDK